MLIELPINPGIAKDNSELLAEGQWIDCDWMRFRNINGRSQPEVMNGYQSLVSTTFTGSARGVHAWGTLAGIGVMTFGTESNVYAISEGLLWNISPFRLSGTIANVARTDSGTPTITINHASHGLVTGDTVYLYNPTTFGGVILGAEMTTTVGGRDATNNSRIISISEPGHTMAGGERVIISGSGALGGIPAASINKTHTVNVESTANFYIGVDTVATSTASNTDGITYKHMYKYTATRIDDNNYSVVSRTGNATSTVYGAGGVINYEFEYSPGSATSTVNDKARIWFFSDFGEFGVANYRNGILYQWNNVPSQRMSAIAATDAPQESLAHMVTPERFLMTLGTEDQSTSTFDPMRIAWASQETGFTTGGWTAAATNTAGDFRLAEGSTIINGVSMPFVSLVWTDTALYQIQFVESLDTVYRQVLVGTSCGLIGPHAFARAGDRGQVYWLSPTQEFMMWQGGAPIIISCPVRDWFFTNLAAGTEDFIHACENEKYDEIAWYFQDTADSSVYRYAAYNYSEGHWTIGSVPVTAIYSRGVFSYPIGLHVNGSVHDHDRGDTANGSALNAYIESGFTDFQNGDNLMMARRYVPDMDNVTGNVRVTVKHKNWPNATATALTIGAFTSTTEKIDFRATARYMAMRFDFTSTSSAGRFGKILVDAMPVGSKR